MKVYLTCPQRGHLVQIEFGHSPEDGRIVGVNRCSAFSPETWVNCDRLCVTLLNEKIDRQLADEEANEPPLTD